MSYPRIFGQPKLLPNPAQIKPGILGRAWFCGSFADGLVAHRDVAATLYPTGSFADVDHG